MLELTYKCATQTEVQLEKKLDEKLKKITEEVHRLSGFLSFFLLTCLALVEEQKKINRQLEEEWKKFRTKADEGLQDLKMKLTEMDSERTRIVLPSTFSKTVHISNCENLYIGNYYVFQENELRNEHSSESGK